MGEWTICAECKEDIEVGWDVYADVIPCPHCGARLDVCYDDCWDGHDEYPEWWTEVVE